MIIALGDETADIPLFLACLVLGATAVVLDREVTPEEAARLARTVDPTFAWVRPELQSAVQAVCDVETEAPAPAVEGSFLPPPAPPADADAAIVFTSGTTSRPKGVRLSHRALTAQLRAFERAYGFDEDARILNLLPLHHVDGLIRGVLAASAFGGELHRPFRFSIDRIPDLHATIRDARISHVAAVPSLLALILRLSRPEDDGFSAPTLRQVISSADVLDEALWRRFEERFGVPVVNSWGQSETVCDALFAGWDPDRRAIGSIGVPLECEARVVNVEAAEGAEQEAGELQIRGDLVMSGYFGLPEETAAAFDDGWLRTGDLVERRPDGSFRFAGRRKTMIVSGGVSIHPENIAEALLRDARVLEACVIGAPDALRGERIVACVVEAQPGAVDAAQLHDVCRKVLPPEKRPHDIIILRELPRGASGKVRIEELRRLAADHDRSVEAGGAAPTVFEVAAKCFGMSVDDLSAESTPFNTDAWDSLNHVAFIEALEAEFRITLTPEEIIGLVSLADAEEIISRRSAT